MKHFIYFEEKRTLFDSDRIKVIVYNRFEKKPIRTVALPACEILDWEEKETIAQTVLFIRHWVNLRHKHNSGFFGGCYAMTETKLRAFDRLRKQCVKLSGFTNARLQANYIYVNMLDDLKLLLSKNESSFPTYRNLLNHIEAHFTPSNAVSKLIAAV